MQVYSSLEQNDWMRQISTFYTLFAYLVVQNYTQNVSLQIVMSAGIS